MPKSMEVRGMGTRSLRGAVAALAASLVFLVVASPPIVGVATAETVPYFSQIDCRAGSACLGTTFRTIWRSADWGTGWEVVLNAPADGVVNGVACSGSTCLAYGGFGSGIAETGGWLAWSSDGGLTFEAPADVGDPVWSAACRGSTCTALARPDEFSATDEAILRGTAFGPLTRYTQDAGFSMDLQGVHITCPNSLTCVAVGDGNDPIMRFDFSGTGASASTYCKLLSPCWALLPKAVECLGSTCIALSWSGYTDRRIGTKIIVSRTTGRSWATKVTYASSNVLDVSCVSTKVCVGVGGSGLAVRSVDYGTTWRKVLTPARSWFQSVSCIPNGRCLAVAMDGAVMYSANSGSSWVLRPTFTGLATP
jgi:hypothetical protein